MRDICLIVQDVRSCHNVGSILRTADGMGVNTVYLTGYTPYPISKKDERLPYVAAKIDRRIHKTALGAEESVNWIHNQDINDVIQELKGNGYKIVALEQTDKSIDLSSLELSEKIAIIVGNEIDGIDQTTLDLVDSLVMIPMYGKKESFNVAQATAMALYRCRLG